MQNQQLLDQDLQLAIRDGNLAQVKSLLAKGANPSIQDNYGKNLNDMM